MKKAKHKSKTYYVWLGQLVIFLSLLMVVLYYIFLYNETIFILFFILIYPFSNTCLISFIMEYYRK